jgi:hypothetical protein
MASFTNVSGGLLVVGDEFGITSSFSKDETKTGLSNYFERYTSTYVTGENILLTRVGDLDAPGTVPVAGIEEENIAVRPSASNRSTQGVVGNAPGGIKDADPSAVVATSFVDLANNAPRLQRVVFNTENDLARRQIDTELIGVRSTLELDELAVVSAGTIVDGATVDTNFDADDNIRGWFEVDGVGLLFLSAAGILELLDGASVNFVAWT